jgi:predicted DNA-binding transcriptional regulator YafY
VTRRGLKNFNLRALFDDIRETSSGGVVEGSIPASEIAWFAAQLLPVGTEAIVEAPDELIATIHEQAQAIVAAYAKE